MAELLPKIQQAINCAAYVVHFNTAVHKQLHETMAAQSDTEQAS